MNCEELRELAPELALGIADGEDRAEALRHLADCAGCRRHVEQLSGVADDLLAMAPAEEPPAGFESRVAAAIEAERTPVRPTWRSPRVIAQRALPALAAAAVAAAVVIGIYSDDRTTAERYRETLAVAGGEYFGAEALTDDVGGRGGVAFVYQGDTPWLLVTIAPEFRERVTGAAIITEDGQTIEIPDFDLDDAGTWGGGIPVDVELVDRVRLIGPEPGYVLRAYFGA